MAPSSEWIVGLKETLANGLFVGMNGGIDRNRSDPSILRHSSAANEAVLNTVLE